jgi:hypothetical protein
MSDTKSQFRTPLYHNGLARDDAANKSSAATEQVASEKRGWDAYRKWLSTVSGKSSTERAPVDNSIYSWKGYHNWADRVKQSWKPE